MGGTCIHEPAGHHGDLKKLFSLASLKFQECIKWGISGCLDFDVLDFPVKPYSIHL